MISGDGRIEIQILFYHQFARDSNARLEYSIRQYLHMPHSYLNFERYRQLPVTWNFEYVVFPDGASHGTRNQWETKYPQRQPKEEYSPRNIKTDEKQPTRLGGHRSRR